MIKERLNRLRKGRNIKALIDFLSFLCLLIFFSYTFTKAPIDDPKALNVEQI